jgi:PII-like signaling protein
MPLHDRSKRLTIVSDERDKAPHSHEPLYCEIVHRAHQAGLAGASVFHGIEGYGASRHVHVNRILSFSGDMPVAVVIVDAPERIEAFLPQLDEMLTGGLVTLEDVQVVRPIAPGHASDPVRVRTSR